MRACRRTALLLIALAAAAAMGMAGAQGGGKPDLKTYFARDFTDQAYQKKVHRKVGLAWKRPEETPEHGHKAVVITTLRRDGTIVEVKLHLKSGSDAWDASAVHAVKTAAPFDPFPKSYPRDELQVHFHFEYN